MKTIRKFYVNSFELTGLTLPKDYQILSLDSGLRLFILGSFFDESEENRTTFQFIVFGEDSKMTGNVEYTGHSHNGYFLFTVKQ